MSTSLLNKVTLVNIALLATHQADAAYWHEWAMFKLPGGIQFFCLLNVLIFVGLLACFVSMIERRQSGYACSFVIAGISALVLPIHAGFALSGVQGFELPLSVFLIVATFVASVLQVFLTFRARNTFSSV